jgi:hypothetical protein
LISRHGEPRQRWSYSVRDSTALLNAADALALLENLANAAPLTPDQRQLLLEALTVQ